jgi:hypothetical protein
MVQGLRKQLSLSLRVAIPGRRGSETESLGTGAVNVPTVPVPDGR